jgi:hypothetical protein
MEIKIMKSFANKLFFCLVANILFTSNLFAYLFTVAILERDGKKVFILGDGHNLASVEENCAQVDTLYSFCSKFGLDNIQVLFEHSTTYDLSFIGASKPSCKLISREGSFEYLMKIAVPIGSHLVINEDRSFHLVIPNFNVMSFEFITPERDLSSVSMISSDERFSKFSKSTDPRWFSLIKMEKTSENLDYDFVRQVPIFTFWKINAFKINSYDQRKLKDQFNTIFETWTERWKSYFSSHTGVDWEIRSNFIQLETRDTISPGSINRLLDIDTASEILKEDAPQYSIVLVGDWHAKNLVGILESLGFSKMKPEIGREIGWDVSSLMKVGERFLLDKDPRYYEAQKFLTSFNLESEQESQSSESLVGKEEKVDEKQEDLSPNERGILSRLFTIELGENFLNPAFVSRFPARILGIFLPWYHLKHNLH